MGWSGPAFEGDFPTLGWGSIDWIEAHCVIPDREHAGDPLRLTDEQKRFLINYYRVHEKADPRFPARAFTHRSGGLLVRSQKWGKGPFTAALICLEAVGPARFGGWGEHGQPIGVPVATPHIQVAAYSEDQTRNVYSSLLPMIELGPLAELIPDTGLGRINLPSGGIIEPVSANAKSRLGARITFAIMDETQLWTKANGGLDLFDTLTRGLAGMQGRYVQTTNSYDPSEQSVAQVVHEGNLGKLRTGHHAVHVDYVQADTKLRFSVKRDRMKILEHVYGDSVLREQPDGTVTGWVDLEVIEADIQTKIKRDPGQLERFYGNRLVQGAGRWLLDAVWESAGRDLPPPPPGSHIFLGFDGSENNDYTALVGMTLEGAAFVPVYGPDDHETIWKPEEWGGQIPRDQVHVAVEELHSRYRVVRFYADPQDWRSEIGEWYSEHGTAAEWATNRIRAMYEVLRSFEVDVASGKVTHLNDPLLTLAVSNSRKVAKPADRYVLGKASEAQKIDPAMAMLLAYEARSDAISSGWKPPAAASNTMRVLRRNGHRRDRALTR